MIPKHHGITYHFISLLLGKQPLSQCDLHIRWHHLNLENPSHFFTAKNHMHRGSKGILRCRTSKRCKWTTSVRPTKWEQMLLTWVDQREWYSYCYNQLLTHLEFSFVVEASRKQQLSNFHAIRRSTHTHTQKIQKRFAWPFTFHISVTSYQLLTLQGKSDAQLTSHAQLHLAMLECCWHADHSRSSALQKYKDVVAIPTYFIHLFQSSTLISVSWQNTPMEPRANQGWLALMYLIVHHPNG